MENENLRYEVSKLRSESSRIVLEMKDLEETFMHLKTEKQLQSVKLQLMENNLQAISSLVDPKPKKVTNEINI